MEPALTTSDMAIARAALAEAADEITAAADLVMLLMLAGMGVGSEYGAAITEGASGVYGRLEAARDRIREAQDEIQPLQGES